MVVIKIYTVNLSISRYFLCRWWAETLVNAKREYVVVAAYMGKMEKWSRTHVVKQGRLDTWNFSCESISWARLLHQGKYLIITKNA